MKKSKKKKILIAVCVLVVITAAIVVVYGNTNGSQTAMAEVFAMKQDLTTYYSYTGNVQSHDTQNVLATNAEPVKKFYVKEGDHVDAGDLLYEVDSNTIQSTLTQAQTSLQNAQNSLNSAKLNYDRMQTLFDIGGISQQELENARDSYLSAQNQVTQASANSSQAQKQYDDTRRYAEVSGDVTKIYVKENESLVMGTSILDIIDYDNLEVTVKIDEYDLASISEGMDAEVTIEALGKALIGRISEIAHEATIESGVSYFEAIVVLPQDDDLRIGLTAEIRIVTQKAENVVAVPIEAVSYSFEGACVQVYGPDGKVQQQNVVVGINNGKMIEIKEGLSEGDGVLITSSGDTALPQQQMMMMRSSGGPPAGGGPGGGNGTRTMPEGN